MDRIFQNKILKSSTGLVIITLLVKLLGYVEKLCLAKYYGTSYQVDVYTTILTIVLAFFYFFREVIEPGFLNVFMYLRNSNEKEAWGLFNKGFRLIFFITIIISGVTILFPSKVISVFAPGFDEAKLNLSTKLIQIAILGCVFLALSTLTNITLNGLKLFSLAASGELVFKAMIILCMVLFYKTHGIIGAVFGIVLGSCVRLSVHLTKLYRYISFRKVTITHETRKNIWLLTWPLLIGVTFSQLSNLIDNVFASYLKEGSIAALSYSKKLIEFPIIIFPYILSIVIFPYFTQLKVEKKLEKQKELLTNSLKWIIISFLPISAFFIIFSTPIVEIAFQRGAFTAESTILTSKPLLIYSFGLIFFAIETILVIFYFANSDTKTPVFVGIACTVLHIILSFVLIQVIGYIGIALAYVIQKLVKNFILLMLLRKKIYVNGNEIKKFVKKVLIAFIIFVMLMGGSKIYLYDIFNHSVIWKTGFIILNNIVLGITYWFLLKMLGIAKPNFLCIAKN
jgi:murein biosynthesis integral membrane protein MurJ